MKFFKRLVVIVLSVSVFISVVYFYLVSKVPKVEPKNFGVTFSKIMAEDFDLDWKEAYLAVFEDLKIKNIRIPVYWQEIEKEEGVYDFSWLDFMLEKAAQNDAKVILAIGRKVPRWPECHEPAWVVNESIEIRNEKLLVFMKKVVERYDSEEVVWMWQVENEPFLSFGICPNANGELLDREIALVKGLSEKEIITTDGGEFGDWFRAYKRGDVFGSTMYRHVVHKYIGEWTYPIPPSYFRFRQALMKTFYGEKPTMVIELQAEPWIEGSVKDSTLERQYEGFGPERFKGMMEYASKTGFDTFYFWGVEWWYWLKEQGHPEMWEMVREASME